MPNSLRLHRPPKPFTECNLGGCTRNATMVLPRRRECGHSVNPWIKVCDQHYHEYKGRSAEKPTTCQTCGRDYPIVFGEQGIVFNPALHA